MNELVDPSFYNQIKEILATARQRSTLVPILLW